MSLSSTPCEKCSLLQFKKDLKPTTLKSYASCYDKIRQHFKGNIADQSTEDLVNYIKSETKISTRLNLLNIIVVVFQMRNKDTFDLIELREKLIDIQNGERKITNAKLTETLPTVKELLDYLDFLSLNKKWIEFIINYLLIHLNCRNADLFIDIVNCVPSETSSNYLVIEDSQIRFIRYIYKTSKTYQKKEDVITDERFIKAVKSLGVRSLILSSCGEKIPLDRIGTNVKRFSFKELGEIVIFKSIMKEATLATVADLSKNRGSAISTLLQFYYTTSS
jgi:hypothetical protein